MIKSIDIKLNDGEYTVSVREGKTLVHQMVFIDPETAEFYAEQYMLSHWGTSLFYQWESMH